MLIINAAIVYSAGNRTPGDADNANLPQGCVRIEGDRIAAVGTADSIDIQDGEDVFDACGGLLFPGLIDTHVHFREPGLEEKGSIATESRAALLGGVTSFVDMPNTRPATLTAEALADKYRRGASSARANYGFFLGASEATPEILDTIPRHRLAGVKLFLGTTTGAVASPSAATLDRIFRMCAERRIVVMVHAEDDAVIAANAAAAIARYGAKESVPVETHAAIRSREACLRATAKAVELATRLSTRLHIAHVSTADEVREFLGAGPVESKLITAETTPMYLDPVLWSTPGWRTKINPAIKTGADAETLRKALADGLIDTIGTDHAPHLAAQKQGGALTAASGAPSIQFALPVMLEYLEPQTIARAMAASPATLFGIEGRGVIAPGAKADLTLISTDTEPHTITDADVATPAGWTPFAGRSVRHRISGVWVNGRQCVRGGLAADAPGAAEELVFGV